MKWVRESKLADFIIYMKKFLNNRTKIWIIVFILLFVFVFWVKLWKEWIIKPFKVYQEYQKKIKQYKKVSKSQFEEIIKNFNKEIILFYFSWYKIKDFWLPTLKKEEKDIFINNILSEKFIYFLNTNSKIFQYFQWY